MPPLHEKGKVGQQFGALRAKNIRQQLRKNDMCPCRQVQCHFYSNRFSFVKLCWAVPDSSILYFREDTTVETNMCTSPCYVRAECLNMHWGIAGIGGPPSTPSTLHSPASATVSHKPRSYQYNRDAQRFEYSIWIVCWVIQTSLHIYCIT